MLGPVCTFCTGNEQVHTYLPPDWLYSPAANCSWIRKILNQKSRINWSRPFDRDHFLTLNTASAVQHCYRGNLAQGRHSTLVSRNIQLKMPHFNTTQRLNYYEVEVCQVTILFSVYNPSIVGPCLTWLGPKTLFTQEDWARVWMTTFKRLFNRFLCSVNTTTKPTGNREENWKN